MLAPIIRTVVLLTLVYFVPLAAMRKLSLLQDWPVWLTMLAGAFLNLSQPAITEKNLKERDPLDQRSALVIMLAAIGVFAFPLIHYAGWIAQPQSLREPLAMAGMALIFSGLAFRYWSIRTLGRFFTSTVQIFDDHRVIERGPYKYIRHPSYLGAFVMALGVSAVYPSWAGLFACMFFFFPAYVYRTSVEEKALLVKLGDAYEAYIQRTWRMIPLIY